jgi:hypothetical protein
VSPESAPVSPAAPGPALPAASVPAAPVAASAGSPAEVFASGPTGHRAVDAALRSLENAAELPEAERIAAYEAAHRTLRETLSTIDDA